MGPLTVSKLNPRYFADPSGHVVLLVGSHTWNNLIDMGPQTPPRAFDYRAYLDFLRAHNHNLVRLWAWETPRPNDERDTPLRKIAVPQPWVRTGPGIDINGLPKFDLTKLDPAYFQRLRARVAAAREQRMYVSIMLFEGWSAQRSPGRASHPFLPSNNVNHTDFLHDPTDIYTLKFPMLTRVQKAYLTSVVDAVDDFDNVLFEIANEAAPSSREWQETMLRLVTCYESTRPLQHPVGLTSRYRATNSALFESDADWIAPGGDDGNYLSRPPKATGEKVIITDSDHLTGSSLADPLWVYRSFFQGLNVLYMDRYYGADALNPEQVSSAPEVRAAMGVVRSIASLLDIGRAAPAPEASTTGYTLREGNWTLVFAPDAAVFGVDLRRMPGQLQLEWFDAVTGQVTPGGIVDGGRISQFEAPGAHGTLLYVRSAFSSAPSLSQIEEQVESIVSASRKYASLAGRVRLILRPALDSLSANYRRQIAALLIFAVVGFVAGLGAAHFSRRVRP